jgi:hypothetical protein
MVIECARQGIASMLVVFKVRARHGKSFAGGERMANILPNHVRDRLREERLEASVARILTRSPLGR